MKIQLSNHPDYVNIIPRALAMILDQVIWAGPMLWCLTNWLQQPDLESLFSRILLDIITILIPAAIAQWLIHLVLMAKFGLSLGKLAFGLQVVSLETKQPIGFWKTMLREFIAKPANALFLDLTYLLVVIDPLHQAIHDHAAGSVVRRQRALGALTGCLILVLIVGLYGWGIWSLVPTIQENSLSLFSQGRAIFLLE